MPLRQVGLAGFGLGLLAHCFSGDTEDVGSGNRPKEMFGDEFPPASAVLSPSPGSPTATIENKNK